MDEWKPLDVGAAGGARWAELVEEVAPGGYCSPRHRVLLISRDEGSNCVG